MSYNNINVTLTPGQIKKLQSSVAKQCGATISLKHNQLTGGPNKLSLTETQTKQISTALKNSKGAQVTLSKAAIANMVKTGGFLPLIAAALAPIIGSLGGFLIDKITGKGIKRPKKKGRLPGSRFTRYQPQ